MLITTLGLISEDFELSEAQISLRVNPVSVLVTSNALKFAQEEKCKRRSGGQGYMEEGCYEEL